MHPPTTTIAPEDSQRGWRTATAPLAVAFIAAVAAFVGLFPIAAFLDRVLWLAGFTIFIFFGVRQAGGRPQTGAVQAPRVRSVAPSPAEFILAAAGSVLPPAAGGMLGFLIYAAVYWITGGIALFLNLCGVAVAPDATAIAFYPTIVFLVLFGFGFVVNVVRQIQQTLYPETADGRSAFYSLVAQGGFKVTVRVLAVVVPLIVMAVLFALGVRATWIYVVLQIALVYGSSPTWQGVARTHTPTPSPQIEEAVAKLFRANGWEVMVAPTSPATDDLGALLSVCDLIAEGPEGAFAVEIGPADEKDSERADIARASNLQTTAWRLLDYRERLGIQAETVRPALVLVGRTAGPRLESFSARSGISIIQIPAEMVKKIESSDSEILGPIAANLLSPLMTDGSESSQRGVPGIGTATQ
jgi:hypothetical protein